MQQNFHRESVNYFWITIGSLLFCAGLNLFIVPVGLYNGGTVGISQIIRTLLQSRLALPAGFDIAGILNLILNIPLPALAFLQFGRPLFLKTVYSVLTQTAFFSLIAIPSVPILSDRLTACIIGGLLAWPVAVFLMGKAAGDIAFYAYIVPFLVSTVGGSIIAGVVLIALEKNSTLKKMQASLAR